MKFPQQFNEPLRTDLIIRAVLALRSRRNAYGANPRAGKEKSIKLSRRRRDYKGTYGKGISRAPRKIISRRGEQIQWVGALAPYTRGGMAAHPPKSQREWLQKINDKERKKAIRSALSATIQKETVQQRGHKTPQQYPIIAEDTFEKLSKTKEIETELEKLGLAEEMQRCQPRSRAGRGNMRGRKTRQPKGPLIVVSEQCPAIKAAKNVPGIDCVTVNSLNAELLAPGTHPGRLAIYTKKALQTMETKRLFI